VIVGGLVIAGVGGWVGGWVGVSLCGGLVSLKLGVSLCSPVTSSAGPAAPCAPPDARGQGRRKGALLQRGEGIAFS
jgi:hypothetical protein